MSAPLGYLDSYGRGLVFCKDCITGWEAQTPARMADPEPVYEGDGYGADGLYAVTPGQVCAYPGCGRVLLEVCDE